MHLLTFASTLDHFLTAFCTTLWVGSVVVIVGGLAAVIRIIRQ